MTVVKRRLRDPDRTRERLLQAAFHEVHRSSFQSVGINRILVRDTWLHPLLGDGHPIDILIGVVQGLPSRPADVRQSCPLLNLAQEMSSLDEQFRKRLEKVFLAWQQGIAALLRKGQSQGTVRRDRNPDEVASFLVALIEGHTSLAKNAQDPRIFEVGIRNIVEWLETLRAPRQSRKGGRRMSKTRVVRQRQRF